MKRHVARELLDKMLTDGVVEEADLRELMKVATEGQFVDFKHGDKLKDPKAAAAMVREYVSGFANADGGLLVIGVDDGPGGAPRKATHAAAPGGIALDIWARDVLENMKGYLVPFPRLQVMKIDGCDVLIVATVRAPLLVPCVDKRNMAHHLRIGSSTVEVPPYLMSDLLLGRRSHPVIEVRSWGEFESKASQEVIRNSIYFWLNLENKGFVTADDLRVGVIAWSESPQVARLASDHLRSFVKVEPVGVHVDGKLRLAHYSSSGGAWAPFEVRSMKVAEPVVIRNGAERPMRSALYVFARGHPPEWFQVDWIGPSTYDHNVELHLTRMVGELPVVAYDSEWRAPKPG